MLYNNLNFLQKTDQYEWETRFLCFLIGLEGKHLTVLVIVVHLMVS
jgi:hypothetical protein